MHVCDCCKQPNKIIQFSETSWLKFIISALQWADLDGPESDIAQLAVKTYTIEERSPIPDVPANKGYHRECYMQFANVRNIARKTKRKEQLTKTTKEDAEAHAAEHDTAPPPKSRLLCSTTTTTTNEEKPPLLPVQCIICRREKYFTDSLSRKKVKENLTQCETLAAGRLCDAAEARKDEGLLLHILGVNLVSAEAKYHFRCYRDYTVFLYKKNNSTGTIQFQTGYKHFCETVVEERLLKKRKVLKLSKLTALFKKSVLDTEGIDISSYKSASLKVRLQNSYPFLKFQKLSRHDFVYVEELTPRQVVHSEVAKTAATTTTTSSSELSSDEDDDTRTTEKDDAHKTRLLFHAAMTLKADMLQKWKTSPPTAQQLTMSAASNLIPDTLFNFIAWTTGVTTDPSTENERVRVSEEDTQKIVAVGQDVINLTMKR